VNLEAVERAKRLLRRRYPRLCDPTEHYRKKKPADFAAGSTLYERKELRDDDTRDP
jgi:hypothetical protein